jgi:CheY-like chemotaxis protein
MGTQMDHADDPPAPGTRVPVVLIVEDEALLRLALAEHLQGCGFTVLEACDAHEAIEIMEIGGEIDVVFTDVKMPGEIDGFGLARWVRDNQPGLVVFVASGYSGKFDLARELCAGEQFFAKPYDLDVIVAKIHEHMNARRKPG